MVGSAPFCSTQTSTLDFGWRKAVWWLAALCWLICTTSCDTDTLTPWEYEIHTGCFVHIRVTLFQIHVITKWLVHSAAMILWYSLNIHKSFITVGILFQNYINLNSIDRNHLNVNFRELWTEKKTKICLTQTQVQGCKTKGSFW